MKRSNTAPCARDIMTRDVWTVGPDAPLEEVARLLVERRISAVPVIDPERRVIGIISEGDLLRRRETATEQRRSWWLEIFVDADTLAREYAKAHGMQAHHVMTRHVFCATETMTLGEIADILEGRRIKRVPVLRDGRLAGIVSRADLVRALLLAEPGEAAEAPSAGDRRIRDELQRRLEREPWSQTMYLQSVVHGGIVEFFGLARSEDQRRGLRVMAETIPGVTRVEDRTSVAAHIYAA